MERLYFYRCIENLIKSILSYICLRILNKISKLTKHYNLGLL